MRDTSCTTTAGAVPGDGQHLTFQELMGLKRAAYALYTGEKIDARALLGG
jgi:enoyl-CoA hydratase/carnithine racemase